MKFIDLKEIQDIETSILKEIHDICQENGLTYYLLCGSALGAIRHGGPIPWDSDADIGVPLDIFERFLSVLQRQLSEKFYIEFCKYDKHSPALHPEIFAKGVDGRVVHVDVFPLFGMPEDREEQIAHWIKIRKCMQDFHSKRFAYIGNRDDLSLRTTIKRVLHYCKCLCKFPFLDSSDSIIRRFDELIKEFPFRTSTYSTFPCMGNTKRAITHTGLYADGRLSQYNGFEFVVPLRCDEYLKELYGDYMTPPPESEREGISRARISPKEYRKYFKA